MNKNRRITWLGTLFVTIPYFGWIITAIIREYPINILWTLWGFMIWFIGVNMLTFEEEKGDEVFRDT